MNFLDSCFKKESLNLLKLDTCLFPLPFQNDLETEDFVNLSPALLYEMFKAHSKYPLHLAIQHNREDVVFLFLVENTSQVGAW